MTPTGCARTGGRQRQPRRARLKMRASLNYSDRHLMSDTMKAPLIILALLISIALAGAQGIAGRVTAVHDGDTITVQTALAKPMKVRLAGIDAPELKQPFGPESRDALKLAVDGKTVLVLSYGTDLYGRTDGQIMCAGVDENLAQLSSGLAWVYTAYVHKLRPLDQITYQQAEATARTNKLGLWIDAAPMPPWKFRKNAKARATPSQDE